MKQAMLIGLSLVVFAAPAGAQVASAGGSATLAQVQTRTVNAEGRVMIHASRVTQPMTIDGRMDEEVYTAVQPITDFIQQTPNEGEPSSERGEAWILFDDNNIYVTCRCWHARPDRIVANDMRRDSRNLSSHDHIAILLDTFNDGRAGLLFSVTAAGGIRDGTLTEGSIAVDWNPVYEVQTSRFDGGWIAEMAIPFKTLRYKDTRDQTWGLLLRRRIASRNETDFITRISPSVQNLLSSSAALVGIEAPPPSRNLEIKPYVISRLTTDLTTNPTVRNDLEPDAGLDVKYSVTKSLTADFTYNTDFAQVEADDAQVNLTRFNLVFPEKREFFLEGAGIFDFGSPGGDNLGSGDAPTIFYSRRIGLSDARVVPVIAGGRLTGKAGPWTIGAFNMETDDDESSGARRTNFGVFRLRHDILRRSTVGGIYERRSVSTIGPGDNQLWGLDTNLAFYQNVFINGYYAQTRTEGRIGEKTSDDIAYRTLFNYTADRYGLGIDRMVVGDNFNPEVGFLRREKFRRNFARARFSPRPNRHPYVRKWTTQGDLEYITNNQNELESRNVNGLFRVEFNNSDSVSAQYLRLYEFLDAPFTVSRGVRIPIGGYEFDNFIVSYTGGSQRRVNGTVSYENGDFYNGTKETFSYRGRFDISSQLGIEPNISLNWIDLPNGSFTNSVISGRATFTMTPRSFVAALVQYSSSNSSVSTNLRFRWEYQPGSELFVVYTEGRTTLPPQGTDLENRGFVVKINRLFRP
jgi:hypothetical protein